MKLQRSGAKSLPTWTVGASLGLVLVAGACSESTESTPPMSVVVLNCWDLNANGACDLATEDTDGDGSCSAADCRGAPGENGIDGIDGIDGVVGTHCWDANENGSCDVDTEDFNADEVCDALDCVGLTNGALDGTVTNAASGNGLVDVAVTILPAAGGPLATAADGTYSVSLPTGFYTVTFSKDDFATVERTVPIAAAQVTTIDVELEPEAPVIVDAGADQTVAPDGTLQLDPTVTISDDSTIESTEWEQIAGVPIVGGDPDPDDDGVADLTFQGVAAYKADLVGQLTLQDRWQVVPLNVENLQKTTTATFLVTVVTTSGTYTDTVTVTVDVPWMVTTGLRNVPINAPVLLQGIGDPTVDTWAWTVVDKDANAVTVTDADTKYPYFTPTVPGAHTATDSVSGTVITMTAGTFLGAIEGQDAGGNPVSTGCAEGCHHDDGAGDEIFALWAPSGHAHAFSDLVSKSYFKPKCYGCHATGYQEDATNGGLDDAADYGAFLSSGTNNWATMLSDYPAAAKMTNVQCDACHGPSASAAHDNDTTQRNSMASEVCASCHGDLPKYGLYQQWQQTQHALYDQALARGTVENGGSNTGRCGRCHAAQGFLHWYRQDDLTQVLQGASGNATNTEMSAWGMNVAQVEPITCATCHDPHDAGVDSGNPNGANVRVEGSVGMLNGGFAAPGMGRGAICVMCHTSIGGRHDDGVAMTSYGMPHQSSQGDVLLGQGAYFVPAGGVMRSPHAYIQDTCTACHMAKSPPPDAVSDGGAGSNHTFAADLESCEACHGEFDGEGVMETGAALMEELHTALADAAVAKLNSMVGGICFQAADPVTGAVSRNGVFPSVANVCVDTAVNPIVAVDFIEFRGQGGLELVFTNNIQWTTTSAVPIDSNVVWAQFATLGDSPPITLTYALSGNYVKGVYNYLLLHADKSEGVHNPGFHNAVVAYTLMQDLSY